MATHRKTRKSARQGTCWSGYEQYGMKKKGGRTVPNCVPAKKKRK